MCGSYKMQMSILDGIYLCTFALFSVKYINRLLKYSLFGVWICIWIEAFVWKYTRASYHRRNNLKDWDAQASENYDEIWNIRNSGRVSLLNFTLMSIIVPHEKYIQDKYLFSQTLTNRQNVKEFSNSSSNNNN